MAAFDRRAIGIRGEGPGLLSKMVALGNFDRLLVPGDQRLERWFPVALRAAISLCAPLSKPVK